MSKIYKSQYIFRYNILTVKLQSVIREMRCMHSVHATRPNNRRRLCLCICARVTEISKALDMHLFLFDDILLLTRVKKAPRKVGAHIRTYDLSVNRGCHWVNWGA